MSGTGARVRLAVRQGPPYSRALASPFVSDGASEASVELLAGQGPSKFLREDQAVLGRPALAHRQLDQGDRAVLGVGADAEA
jgi:hypothetical protein